MPIKSSFRVEAFNEYSCSRLLLILLVVCSSFVLAPKVSLAQENPPAAAPAPAAAGDANEEPKHAQSSGIIWIIKTSGPIGGIILILSFFLIATIVRLTMELRPQIVEPPEILGAVQRLDRTTRFPGLYTFVQADDSLFSKAVSAGLTEIPHGLHEAREAMDLVGEVETSAMEKKVSILGMLGTLGPMIGLLGTLSGMIKSFAEIGSAGENLKAEKIAEGISGRCCSHSKGCLGDHRHHRLYDIQGPDCQPGFFDVAHFGQNAPSGCSRDQDQSTCSTTPTTGATVNALMPAGMTRQNLSLAVLNICKQKTVTHLSRLLLNRFQR